MEDLRKIEAALVTLGGQQFTTSVALLGSQCLTDHLWFRISTVQHGQSGGHRQGRTQGGIRKDSLTLFSLQISCEWLIKFVEQLNLPEHLMTLIQALAKHSALV